MLVRGCGSEYYCLQIMELDNTKLHILDRLILLSKHEQISFTQGKGKSPKWVKMHDLK